MESLQPQEQDSGDTGITRDTLREAEKLAGVQFTDVEREMILQGIGGDVQRYLARRAFYPPNHLAPATAFDPRLRSVTYEIRDRGVTRSVHDLPLPETDSDIAYAPLTDLSHWIETRALTSERLTRIYLERLKEYGPQLECVVTLTEELAMAQARAADLAIEAGGYRGALHGIPYGAKDLLDTKGIRTSWGAMPYRDRVPAEDAAVVKMLEEAGAVLVAKLTLGALAYGDIWFGGRTNNPFNLEQGSSGSSAGSAAATAAGLVGFSIGTETLGSIVSPSMRCGTTGLRPTFGRVPRTGAMALCWSLDKIGPICRTVEDCALVLDAINGYDAGDASSIHAPFEFDAGRSVVGMRVGFDPRWYQGRRVSEIDRAAFESLQKRGVTMVEIELPDLPYGALMTILIAEAATAFEEITLNNTDDTMQWQEPEAWPNTFRQARFIPAIELVQADRFRRHVMHAFHDIWEEHRLSAMFGPSYAGPMLLVTNNTGHPSMTIRAGFNENGTPHGVTFWGRLFDEGTICNLAMALEGDLDVWSVRPANFE